MPRILRTLPTFTYGSLCSGIEAATVAWEPLGWKPAFFSEIEPFPSAVLAHHWPDVPNLGDMTKHKDWNLNAKIDLLVAGCPCQAFSVAGLRKGLEDTRGNLTLTFIDIADQYDPDWIVYENVPGILSSKDNAFGCFLGGLAGEDDALIPPGGKWADAGCVFGPARTIAWRILDAQHFQLAQRRRRVFVVASPRYREGPCSVLFEQEGMRRDSPPSREKGEGASRGIEIGPSGGRFTDLNPTLDTRAKDGPIRNQLAGAVFSIQERAICENPNAGPDGVGVKGDGTAYTLEARQVPQAVAAFWNGEQVTQTLDAVLAKGQTMPEKNRFPAVLVPATTHILKAEGFDASEDRTGRGVPLVPVAYDDRNQAAMEDLHHTLRAGACGSRVGDAVAFHHNAQADQLPTAARDTSVTDALTCSQGAAVAFETRVARNGRRAPSSVVSALKASAGQGDAAPCVASAMQVRRLTPVECERLQGFPDFWTRIPKKWYKARRITKNRPEDLWEPDPKGGWWLMAADGPRYKAIGNSMATPCMFFIGSRIKRFMEGTL